MNFYEKFNKIEKKADSLSKIKKINEIKKEKESKHFELPKIPIDAFTTLDDYINYELELIHPTSIFSTAHHHQTNPNSLILQFSNLMEIFSTVNQIYYLTMPINLDEKNEYLFKSSEKTISIEFDKRIDHIKNQEQINSFMKNITPKVHQALLNNNYKVEVCTYFELVTQTRKLSIKVKTYNSPNKSTKTQK